MIEAMACGAPVLALPGGAVQEVVRDGVSGFICRSVDELAARAESAHEDFDAETVRSYVLQNFSLASMAARYADLYDEIVAPRDAALMAQSRSDKSEAGNRAIA